MTRSLLFVSAVHFISDENECDLGKDHCGPGGRCENSYGSYNCRCKEGYRLKREPNGHTTCEGNYA